MVTLLKILVGFVFVLGWMMGGYGQTAPEENLGAVEDVVAQADPKDSGDPALAGTGSDDQLFEDPFADLPPEPAVTQEDVTPTEMGQELPPDAPIPESPEPLDTPPEVDVFGIQKDVSGIKTRPQNPDPQVREALDLPDELYEEVQKDPFSYLGNIRYEDIYVIQKKYGRKKGRFFITGAGGGGNVFSQFAWTWVQGLAAGYFFLDVLGWEAVHALFCSSFFTSLSDRMVESFDLRADSFEHRLQLALSSTLQWSPFYGKFALLGVRVIHYDMYLMAGPVVSMYEKTFGFGGVVGLGFRFMFTQWASMNVEFRNYFTSESTPDHIDQFQTETETEMRSRFFIFLSLSVFFPKFAFLDEV